MSVEELSQQIVESLKETLTKQVKVLIPNLVTSLLPTSTTLTQDAIRFQLQQINIFVECLQDNHDTQQEFN